MNHRAITFSGLELAPPMPRGRHRRDLVGSAVFHSTGDRWDAVKRLALDFDQTYADIGHAVGELPYGSAEAAARAKARPDLVIWWQSVASPVFTEWAKFKAEQLSGDTTGPGGSYIALGERFNTEWDVYVHWRTRLVTLRAGARSLGIKLTSSEPAPLPTTFAEDVANVVKHGADAAKEGIGDIWKIVKYAIWAALALVGGLGLVYLINELRGPTINKAIASRVG